MPSSAMSRFFCAMAANAKTAALCNAAVSLSEKAGVAGLFRQDTFPLRLGRGRGNVQGNLAAQGFRTRRACRRVRMAVGGLRPSKPPKVFFYGSGVHAAAADGIGRGLPPLPASPQKCVPFVDTQRPPRFATRRSGRAGDYRALLMASQIRL